MPNQQTSTAEQLREARLRIAALERELEVLRASTDDTCGGHTLNASNSNTNTNNTCSPCVVKRAAATTDAGAVAAAGASYSDVSRDQSQLSVSCLDVAINHTSNDSSVTPTLTTPPPSSSISPYLETKPSSTNTSPALSDVPSLTNKKQAFKASSAAAAAAIKSEDIISPVLSSCTPQQQQQQQQHHHHHHHQHHHEQQQQQQQQAVASNNRVTSCASQPQSSTSSQPMNQTQAIAPAPALTCAPTPTSTSKPHASSATTACGATSVGQNSVPKRRPPSLSVAKTTSTKKDRSSIVAKCLEPRPGQTRYWTEEEHERFLEAIAEYGEKAYVAISNYVETRTPKQVRTHAQKFQMKMARLARQSLEAGQPIQMPPGMCPVIEVPVGSKSTIVPFTPEQRAKLCARSAEGGGPIDATSIVSTLSPSRHVAKKRGSSKHAKQHQHLQQHSQQARPSSKQEYEHEHEHEADGDDKSWKQGEDEIDIEMDDKEEFKCEDKASESRGDEEGEESSSSLTDPCEEFISCAEVAAGSAKDEMELESNFAAKLKHTLQGATAVGEDEEGADNAGDFLMSEQSTSDAATRVEVDDLEDLEKLEDGDLSLAAFTNPAENWLLPDPSTIPLV